MTCSPHRVDEQFMRSLERFIPLQDPYWGGPPAIIEVADVGGDSDV